MRDDYWRHCAVPNKARVNRSRLKNCGGRWGLKEAPRREAVFDAEFRRDLEFWVRTDRKIALRVIELVEAVIRDPFQGIGKPESLKHELAGCWSRRISPEHRLVYRISGARVDFLQARYHYE